MSDGTIPSVAVVVKETIYMGKYKFEACLLSNESVRSTGETEEEAISSLRSVLTKYHKKHGGRETKRTKKPMKIVMMDFNEMFVEGVMSE